jgi:(S)-mandelate dehydrogenase
MRSYYRGRDLNRVHSVAEMANLAKRRLPAFVWEYLQGAAEDEITLCENRAAFRRVKMSPHVCVPCDELDLSLSVLGETSALPMAIAPTGYNGMLYPEADIKLAKAAYKQRIPFTLSTVSTSSLEEVRAQVPDLNMWFQLYPMKDKSIQLDLLERAKRQGVTTLLVTVDAPVLGNREWDRRNFTAPRQLSLLNKVETLFHPMWCKDVLFPKGLPMIGNLTPYLPLDQRNALGSMTFIGQQMEHRFSWDSLAEIRNAWHGKLVVKGVLNKDDAVLIEQMGCDGIVVSNHGGRQLDGATSSLSALQSIAPVLSGRMPVLLDSGIRRGADVVKAIHYGADAVLLGRAVLYGVAAAGSDGAERSVSLLKEELIRAMHLLGCRRLQEIKRALFVQ